MDRLGILLPQYFHNGQITNISMTSCATQTRLTDKQVLSKSSWLLVSIEAPTATGTEKHRNQLQLEDHEFWVETLGEA
eukprot:3890030-Amphidinium_carterae.1